jgi:two-component system sensor histidine kinase UhpB
MIEEMRTSSRTVRSVGRRLGPRPGRSLVWRLFVTNTAVILVVFSLLAFSPLSVRSPLRPWEGGFYSLAGLAAVVLVNLAVMRRALAPLTDLTRAMRRVDPLRPGQRVPASNADAEVAELGLAFNDMLRRLEDERRESVRRTLRAQEAERLDLARDLHDEIGQRLTALMLQLDYVGGDAPSSISPSIEAAREYARETLGEVRRLARSLRPEVLDELGLRSAIIDLTERFMALTSIEITRELPARLPVLSREVELVIYRVAQESLTNVVRHSGASAVSLEIVADDRELSLRVVDDGRGGADLHEGAGIKGMRERAMLIGARLSVSRGPAGGVDVRLDVAVPGAGDGRERVLQSAHAD